MSTYRILVVDDEEDLCEILQFNLETEGYDVDVAYSAEEALKKDLTVYNLLLLDVMMGEISGFRMAKMLHDNPLTASIPIIFLTAKDSENDRITGFSIGADDYISKPFSIREVLARVKAVLRRIVEANPLPVIPKSQVVAYETLELILDKKKVLLAGVALSFTKKEFEMLKLFLENRNRVFTREEILGRIWSDEVVVLDRTIDVNITRLRKKIGPYGKNIVTRLGYGYCFED
jgi:two-component system, OmpR family, alkaline phosphatase synthesis response regulator PhoP